MNLKSHLPAQSETVMEIPQPPSSLPLPWRARPGLSDDFNETRTTRRGRWEARIIGRSGEKRVTGGCVSCPRALDGIAEWREPSTNCLTFVRIEKAIGDGKDPYPCPSLPFFFTWIDIRALHFGLRITVRLKILAISYKNNEKRLFLLQSAFIWISHLNKTFNDLQKYVNHSVSVLWRITFVLDHFSYPLRHGQT